MGARQPPRIKVGERGVIFYGMGSMHATVGFYPPDPQQHECQLMECATGILSVQDR
jgi:hypothetical protein